MALTLEDIYEKFADLYWPAVNHYRAGIQIENTHSRINSRFLSEYRASLKWLLKHCGKLVPPNASLAALDIASQNNIDLFRLPWDDQPRAEEIINGVFGRNIFIHEHQYPVNDLYIEILAAADRDTILSILRRQSIVWITRDENNRLPRNEREFNAYELVGIPIEINPYGNLWMEEHWQQ